MQRTILNTNKLYNNDLIISHKSYLTNVAESCQYLFLKWKKRLWGHMYKHMYIFNKLFLEMTFKNISFNTIL